MNPKGLALLLITPAVFSGTTATVVHNTSVFRPDGGTTLTIHDKDGKTALEQCMDMAKAAPGKSTCTDVYGITTAGTCDDVAKPKWPIEKDADGFIKRPGFKEDGLKPGTNEVQFLVEDFVKGPGYPDCWVPGFRIAEVQDFGPYEDVVEMPNDETPATKPAGFDEEYHTLAAESVRHETCVCYSDDLTACPAKCPG